MHAKAGGRVDFANAAADLLVAFSDVGAEEIHATHVEADRRDRAYRHVAIVGVNHVSHVGGGAAGGQVGGGSQHHHLPFGRNRVGRHAHPREHHVGLLVEHDAGHDFFMADAAARILVDVVHQLANGQSAVADHMPGRAAGGGDEFAVHHQQPMVVAGQVGFHDHRRRVFGGRGETVADFLLAGQVNRNATAVIAVVGFGDHRITQALGGGHRAIGGTDQLLPRHRQSTRGENPVGLFLVPGQFHGDVTGAAGDRRLDALLPLAVTQLDQRLIVHAQPRDAALFRRAHQRCGRGPEGAALRIADVFVACFWPLPAFGHGIFRPNVFRQQ